MGDRHKNFEDPITEIRDIRRKIFDLLGFFWITLYMWRCGVADTKPKMYVLGNGRMSHEKLKEYKKLSLES